MGDRPGRNQNQLKQQWDKIYDSGCWPHSKIEEINTELRLDGNEIDKMERDIEMYEVDKALDQLHASTSAGTQIFHRNFLKI